MPRPPGPRARARIGAVTNAMRLPDDRRRRPRPPALPAGRVAASPLAARLVGARAASVTRRRGRRAAGAPTRRRSPARASPAGRRAARRACAPTSGWPAPPRTRRRGSGGARTRAGLPVTIARSGTSARHHGAGADHRADADARAAREDRALVAEPGVVADLERRAGHGVLGQRPDGRVVEGGVHREALGRVAPAEHRDLRRHRHVAADRRPPRGGARAAGRRRRSTRPTSTPWRSRSRARAVAERKGPPSRRRARRTAASSARSPGSGARRTAAASPERRSSPGRSCTAPISGPYGPGVGRVRRGTP